MHRAVYLDNIATPLLLAAFLLVLSPTHRLAAHAAAGLCLAAAVLAKETSLLLVPAVVWQHWQVSDRRTRRYSLILAGSLFSWSSPPTFCPPPSEANSCPAQGM
jgi:hypothetical protein